jgi:DNA-binding transcriptional LysR family regulator
MNIQQLRYLSALAVSETLTAAADSLGVSQPVMSRALHELEDELKTPILKKSGRKLSFTPEGVEVLAAARRAVTAFDDVALAATPQSRDWVLRIGICHSSFVQLLSLLENLMRKFDNLRVKTTHAAGTEEMLQLMREGAVDVCYGIETKVRRDVVFTPHQTLEVVLISPPRVELPDRVRIADVAALPMVGPPASRERARLMPGFRPNIVFECEDPSVFAEAVREGLGSSVAWRSVAESMPGVQMRAFTPPRTVPAGFYHPKKPAFHVRSLLALARQMNAGGKGGETASPEAPASGGAAPKASRAPRKRPGAKLAMQDD